MAVPACIAGSGYTWEALLLTITPLPSQQQYMNRKNSTKTLLWPSPSAWDGWKLQDHIPWRLMDNVDKRARALRVLALYRWVRAGRRQGRRQAAGQLD